MPDPDIIPKFVPALSSTGDVPVFLSPPPTSEDAGTPPPADPEGGADHPPAVEPQPTEQDGGEPGSTEPPAEGEEEPAPTKPPAETRTDPRTERIRAAEAERAKLADLLAKAIDALQARSEPPAPVAPTPAPPPDPKPTRADFDNPEDYDAALVQWNTRSVLAEYEARNAAKVAAEKAAEDKRIADERIAEQNKATNDQWMARRQEAITKREDYVESENALIEATNDLNGEQQTRLAAMLMTVPDGADITYYLGRNTAEAKRIALIPDVAHQLYEMGKISAKLAQPRPVQVSRTPAPIVPLRGPTPAAEKSPDEMTMEEYAAHKASQRAAQFQNRQRAH